MPRCVRRLYKLSNPSGGGGGSRSLVNAALFFFQVTVIADFHSGSVTSCAHLILEKCLATIGSDSTLRIWDYGYNVLKSKTNIGERPTCMAVGQSAMSHILLAVGHGTGTVRIVNVEDPNAPKVVMREKLDEVWRA